MEVSYLSVLLHNLMKKVGVTLSLVVQRKKSINGIFEHLSSIKYTFRLRMLKVAINQSRLDKRHSSLKTRFLLKSF